MRFGLLGPTLLVVRDQAVAISSAKQRATLAVLLMRGNQIVTVDRLIDELWGPAPPSSARGSVATYIWRLRRLLQTEAGEDCPLVSVPDGYRLQVRDDELDAAQFNRLHELGRAQLARGEVQSAADTLSAALDLWRGDPLDDVVLHGALADEATRLADERLAALEQRIEADLALGRHQAVCPQLRLLVERHPLRERFAVQLMIALYRSGRQTEALAVFRQARELLAGEFGLEPGEELAATHRMILRSDASDRPRAAEGRSSLRAPERRFYGRGTELAVLGDALHDRLTAARPAPLVGVVTGTAGVGKSCLALRWAYQVRGEFPDGQLFVCLHSHSNLERVSAPAALRRILRDLCGPAAQPPIDEDELAGRYRSVLARRRALLVIDDVPDAATAAFFLPDSGGSAVLFTSRTPLDELTRSHGAVRVDLRPLNAQDSHAMLADRAASADRFTDHASTAELADLCGHLPLALKLAGAHLEKHPTLSVSEYVAQIQQGDRVTLLGGAQQTVRRTFDHSYNTLRETDARAFRLLGLLAGPDTDAAPVAAMLDVSLADADATLQRLCAAHLIERTADGHFGLHDLLRAYAADRARETEPAADVEGALDRWLGWHSTAAVAADFVLDPLRYREPLDRPPEAPPHPTPVDRREALAWLDRERANLVAAIFKAARYKRHRTAWTLAWGLFSYFDLRKPWTDWIDTYQLGLSCARAAGDPHGQAVMNYGLATAFYYPRRFSEALDRYRAALGIHRQTGDRRGEGVALNGIANVFMESDRLDDAIKYYLKALTIHAADGNHRDEGVVLNNLSETYCKLSRYREAEQYAQRALVIQREVANRRVEVFTLSHLANARAGQGDLSAGSRLLHEAVDLASQIGDLQAQAWALNYLGHVALQNGDPRESRKHWRDAAAAFAALGDPAAAEVRARLLALDHDLPSPGHPLSPDPDTSRPADRHFDGDLILDRGDTGRH